MNKKEVAEIKRQFKLDNKNFTIDKVAIYYINNKSDIICNTTKRFTETKNMINGKSTTNYWGEIDQLNFLDIFKKTLSGQLGKALVEYYFKNEIMIDKKSVYSKLYDLYTDALEDDNLILNYVKFLKDTLNLDKEYAICLAYCTYNIPNKDINGDRIQDDEFTDTHDFILVSLCNVELSNIGLYYNTLDKVIEHKDNKDKTISYPFAGFTFPTFSERTTDINSVLVYNKKPKEPLITLIQNVLGCDYIMDPEQEKDKFNSLITKIITKSNDSNISIDYSTTKKIYDDISNTIENNILETEITTLTSNDIKSILKRSGVSDDKLDNFEDIYKQEIGNKDIKLRATNLIDSTKLDIKSPSISIKVKPDKTDKIQPTIIDGKRYLMVEMDENVEINGLKVNVK